MKPVLIGGIGNVLLGDDGVGPYVVRLLESRYDFGDNIEIADLGTPALDLLHRIAGRQAVILVDCVASAEDASGTVLIYRKEDILRIAPKPRLDPHSPALSECLLTAEMLDASPENLLLVGVVGERLEPGCNLSTPVRNSLQAAIDAVVRELRSLGYVVTERRFVGDSHIWWVDHAVTLSR